MDPTQILAVEAATDAFALALTNALVEDDPWQNRAAVYEYVRLEAAMAASDIGRMVLGLSETFGLSVQS